MNLSKEAEAYIEYYRKINAAGDCNDNQLAQLTYLKGKIPKTELPEVMQIVSNLK